MRAYRWFWVKLELFHAILKEFVTMLGKVVRPKLKTNQSPESNAPPSTVLYIKPGQEGLCTAGRSWLLHTQWVSTPLPPVSAWPLQCSTLPSQAALYCLPSSLPPLLLLIATWFFPSAFYTESHFSFPNSSGNVLVDCYQSPESLTPAHHPNDEAIQPGWGPCLMTFFLNV